jgi:hypothetical protein
MRAYLVYKPVKIENGVYTFKNMYNGTHLAANVLFIVWPFGSISLKVMLITVIVLPPTI